MLSFNRHAKFFWLLIMLSGLTACLSTDNPSQQSATNIATDVVEPITERPIDQFQRSRKLLSEQQQGLVAAIYQSVSSNDQNLSIDVLGRQVRTLEAYITSAQSEQVPSMLFLALGDGYQQLAQVDNAISAWQQSITANSFNYFAHDRLAQALRQQGDFSGAEQHYEQALAAWPDFANGYRNRGILYDLYIGDKAKALDDYQAYKRLLEVAGSDTTEVERWLKELQRAVNP